LGELCLCEGMETGLSLQRMSGIPTWASAGSTMLPSIVLPTAVHTVTIGADADPAGERTALEAANVFASQGRAVRIVRPLDGCGDFNDELQKEAR
jgi:DNA primase